MSFLLYALCGLVILIVLAIPAVWLLAYLRTTAAKTLDDDHARHD
jgi:hypothetical protein